MKLKVLESVAATDITFACLQHLRRLPAKGEFAGGNYMAESLIHVNNVALVDPEDK